MRFCLKQVANFVLLATGGYELYSTTICTKPQSRLTKKSSVQFPETKCTSLTRNRILKYRDAMTIAGVTFTGKFLAYLFQTIPAKSSWDTWAVSRIPSNQCWKISRFFQHKVTEKHLIIKIELGGGRTSGTYFVSQFFCTKGTRSTQRKSCYTTKRSYPLGVWKGVGSKPRTKK